MSFGKHKSETPRGAHAKAPGVPSTVVPVGLGSMRAAAQPVKSQGHPRIWRAIFIISIVVLIAALAVLGAIVYQYWSQDKAYEDLEQYVSVSDTAAEDPFSIEVDWDALRAINPDIVGWIYVPDTPINYPVVQGSDNEEYLHKAFDGSTGWLASAGTIFLDASNSSTFADRNSALYGHHMNNGSMFATLADWEDSDEFNRHRDLYLFTPQGDYHLKTFALVKTTGSDAIVQTTFADDASYASYIQDKFNRSAVVQSGEVLSASDVKQSLMLSTCEYTQTDGRAVVFAAVVETTVVSDPYFSSIDSSISGLTNEQGAEVASEYQEAA